MQKSIGRLAFFIIIILSVVVPVVVAFIIFSEGKTGFGNWVKVLPHLNAILNSITAIMLAFGLMMIKRKNVQLHRLAMTISFILGALFLTSYILYHSSVPSVIYGDVNGDGILNDSEQNQLGSMRSTYLFLLLSHISLSVVVVPLVLFAFYYALSDKIESHKRIVKYTWPIWFYVSVSGVLVYLMISPYYH